MRIVLLLPSRHPGVSPRFTFLFYVFSLFRQCPWRSGPLTPRPCGPYTTHSPLLARRPPCGSSFSVAGANSLTVRLDISLLDLFGYFVSFPPFSLFHARFLRFLFLQGYFLGDCEVWITFGCAELPLQHLCQQPQRHLLVFFV